MKMELLQRITQKYKELSENTTKNRCQKTGQPGRNGQILKHTHTPKLKQEEIEHLNRPITSEETETVIKNLPKIRVQDKMASLGSFTRHLKQTYTYPSQAIPKNRKERKTSRLIL